MEIDGGLPRQIAVALATLEPTLPSEMADTLARFADEWGVRSQALGGLSKTYLALHPHGLWPTPCSQDRSSWLSRARQPPFATPLAKIATIAARGQKHDRASATSKTAGPPAALAVPVRV